MFYFHCYILSFWKQSWNYFFICKFVLSNFKTYIYSRRRLMGRLVNGIKIILIDNSHYSFITKFTLKYYQSVFGIRLSLSPSDPVMRLQLYFLSYLPKYSQYSILSSTSFSHSPVNINVSFLFARLPPSLSLLSSISSGRVFVSLLSAC